MLAWTALALAAFAGAGSWPDLPVHPVIVQLQDDASPDAFCRSAGFQNMLQGHAFQRVVRPQDGSPYDFTLSCGALGDGRLVLALKDASGTHVRGLKVTRSPGDEAKTAIIAARELATDSKVIEAAGKRRLDRNRYFHAAAGDAAFRRGDWSQAVAELESCLESDIPEAALFYGLYAAHAALGNADRAKWYLAAFLKTDSKKLSELSAEQLKPLKSMVPVRAVENERTLELQRRLASATANKEWTQAIAMTKEIARWTPWFAPAYDSLARSYAAVKWTPFEEHWRRRHRLARRVNEDKQLHDAIEQAALAR